MKLCIDGRKMDVQTGMRLIDAVKQLGLDSDSLAKRPLAAKMAGEVFNLNYIPVRRQEAEPDRPSIRRAMAASGGIVHLLRYEDPTGREVYVRTAQFEIFLALRQLWPRARAKMNCTVGAGLYIEVQGAETFCADKLKERVGELVAQDIPLLRRRVSVQTAIEHFRADGQTDKARLLSWRQEPYFDEYA